MRADEQSWRIHAFAVVAADHCAEGVDADLIAARLAHHHAYRLRCLSMGGGQEQPGQIVGMIAEPAQLHQAIIGASAEGREGG